MKKLNEEFVRLLKKHEFDTTIINEKSKKEWKEQFEDGNEEDYATYYNAWDELKDSFPEETKGLNWYFGAGFIGYDNPWDVYVGKAYTVKVTYVITKYFEEFAPSEETAKWMAEANAEDDSLDYFQATEPITEIVG